MTKILVELDENEIGIVIRAVQKAEREEIDFAATQMGDAHKITMSRASTLARVRAKLYNAEHNYIKNQKS